MATCAFLRKSLMNTYVSTCRMYISITAPMVPWCNLVWQGTAGISPHSAVTVQLMLAGSDVLTTRTNYGLIMGTNTPQRCVLPLTTSLSLNCYWNFVWVVKAPSSIQPKNPRQYAADLQMLKQQETLLSVFQNPETGAPKSMDAIWEDGAWDEGPSHEEV